MLQAYVKDLSEQNTVLVQTVEELEREANDRVSLLEAKLRRSASTVKVRVGHSVCVCLCLCVCVCVCLCVLGRGAYTCLCGFEHREGHRCHLLHITPGVRTKPRETCKHIKSEVKLNTERNARRGHQLHENSESFQSDKCEIMWLKRVRQDKGFQQVQRVFCSCLAAG